MKMIPNVDQISIFQNEDRPVPGEGVGNSVLLKLLDKYMWTKQAHLDIWKELPFTL